MSTTTVELQDAAGRLRELLALIQKGMEIIIIEGGIPRAVNSCIEHKPDVSDERRNAH